MIIDEYFMITHQKESSSWTFWKSEVDVCCLTELSVSKQHSVNDSMVNECGAVGGMRIDP
jgi:hypothetical protein